MNNILDKYSSKHVDIILSHTCPLKYEPVESFKLKLDQSKIDKTMEKFLDVVEEKMIMINGIVDIIILKNRLIN